MKSLVQESETLLSAAPSCGGQCSLHAGRTESASTPATWAATPIRRRLRILRDARHRMAEQTGVFAAAISPALARSHADTLVTELLPLLDACRFLERNAAKALQPRRLGRAGRPLWLSGVAAEVHRVPLGHVLVIGAANFPLFLAGAQVLQALAAGNTVTWKPGTGGLAVAQLVAHALAEAGLPEGAMQLTADTVDAGRQALAARPDKVIFTGSHETGVSILGELAATATPAVAELSGADAVIVLPSADLELVAKAVAFGLRLNGGAVCMSPRRLFAKESTLDALRPLLLRALADIPAVTLNPATAERLTTLVEDAVGQGAHVLGAVQPQAQKPLLLDRATAGMAITAGDLFAPVLSLIAAPTLLHLQEAYARCPYALTASIFCGAEDLPKARSLADTLRAGTVLINDIIAPTADPRVPFGGRCASGFGVTRGLEGLLEMTAVKTLLVRRRGSARHYAATTAVDTPLFAGLIRASHGRTLRARLAGLRQFLSTARKKDR